jgi:hypothetical protein
VSPAASSTKEIYFPTLGRAWAPTAPPGSLGPDAPAIWRDMLNFVTHDGILRMRPAITPGTFTDPSQGNSLSQEAAVWLWTGSDAGQARIALVTNRQIYSYFGGTWTNVLPTYATGTIGVTNGSPNVVGTGTAWLTRGITAGQLLSIGGVVYDIAGVTGDTALTISPNYGAATGSGFAYSIRRAFDGGATLSETSIVHATISKGDLYVAGTYCGAGDGTAVPAVIKVTDVFGTPVTTYLTAKADLTGSLDEITSLLSISGIKVLQDGRVVISGNKSTLFFSSNLNQAVWTTSPGGEVDVTMIEGTINALGNMGSALTLHYQDGIVLAHPTGQADPPLAFQLSGSTVGCMCPRTLVRTSSGEGFFGHDQFYLFDGNSSTPIGDSLRAYLSDIPTSTQRLKLHCSLDVRRNELYLWRVYDTAGSTQYVTKAWIFSFDTGAWTPLQFPSLITAAANRDDSDEADTFIGLSNRDAGGTKRRLVSLLAENLTVDVGDTYSSSSGTGGLYLMTDDLDAGDPRLYKAVQAVILWARGVTAGSVGIKVGISRDGGANWTETPSKTLALIATGEKPYQFSLNDLLPASGLFRIRIISNDSTGTALMPTRMNITAQLGGLLQQVEL